MAQLRVIKNSDKPGQTFEDAARATFERVLAETSGAIVFIYETENGAEIGSTPSLWAVRRGLIDIAFETIHGDE